MTLTLIKNELFSRFVSCARGGSLLNTFVEAVGRKMAGASAQVNKINLTRGEIFEENFAAENSNLKKLPQRKDAICAKKNE